MIKRTLCFTTPLQLSLKNAQLVIKIKDTPGEIQEIRTVPVEDIGMVIIENQRVSISMPLLNELVDAGVAVILCDSKGLPHAVLQNLDGNSLQGEYLRNQIKVGEVLRKQLWKQLVEAKISNQSALLEKLHHNGSVLKPYYMNVKSGDADNREGAAARVYWSAVFGDDFVRERTQEGVNSLLNYGYTILRAAVARALVSAGLTPALGIFHHNRSNAFPLADDVMEPFRPFVDEIVYHLCEEDKLEVDKNTKMELLGILTCDTCFEKVTRPLQIGLSMTCASLARCYSGEDKKLSLPMLR